MSEVYQVAVVNWAEGDGIAAAIHGELVELGHRPVHFKFDETVPAGTDVVFSFAPYGRFLQIPHQLARMPVQDRPTLVHWNLESLPNPKIPWLLMSTLGAWRSWFDRLNDARYDWVRHSAGKPPISWLNKRMHKFRYLGDYCYAYGQGWLDILVESSRVHARLYRRHGVPALFVPWGTAQRWHADLDIERDIDVLWMGKRRTARRRKLLGQVRSRLSASGVEMYVADNVENPFIFGEERTRFLNRAKITLNILPTWYDTAFAFRFHMAAGNRSLVVSDPVLPHCPAYEAGVHYVSAPVDRMVDAILYYLENEEERLQIAENAYRLVTTELTLGSSIRSVMEAVDGVRARRRPDWGRG